MSLESEHTLLETEKAYIAGFFDGEGSITIAIQKSNPNGAVIVQISNTNKPVLEWIQSKFGGSIHIKTRENERQQNSWKLDICSLMANRFLKTIQPYLKLKTPQAQLAIEFQKTSHKQPTRHVPHHILQKRRELHNQLLTLNSHKHTRTNQIHKPAKTTPPKHTPL